MATARYTRIDGRTSSSNWSNVAIIGFVCVCLVAVWMIVSSSVSPLQNARIYFQHITGAREDGNMPSEESKNLTGRGQQQQLAKDSSNDNEKVISREDKGEMKRDAVNPDDNKASNMTRDSIPSEELENLTGGSQQQHLAKDSSNDNEKVVSSEESNEMKKDKVNPDENKASNMPQDKSNNLVPDGNERIDQNEDKKNRAYETSDGTGISVPASSSIEVHQDEMEKNATNEVFPNQGINEDKKNGVYETSDGPGISVPVSSSIEIHQDEMQKNATNEVLPDQGNNLDLSSNSFGDDSSRKPAGNGTANEIGQDRVNDLNLEKVGQNQTEDLGKIPDENALNNSLKGNTNRQSETITQANDCLTQSAKSKRERASHDVPLSEQQSSYSWKLCNTSAGPDYIPCLDNMKAIKKLHSTKHYEHRERHCPVESPTCLVPLPERYRSPVKWPKSRDKIWFSNVPHTQLANYKGRQNWVKISGQFIIFPGGGTQFPHGAPHYIDLVQQAIPEIAWGKRTRVVLDVGCGVASFGGYLFDKDVLTMSMAPKDEHEAQVQFALERGIPAISGVMGTKRLLFPSKVFDVVHCSRCRVPWHIEGGKLLLELNRVLRPGGYFVWSATPVYRKNDVDVGIWKDMYRLATSMCWELIKISRDNVNRKATALFRKTTSNDCYLSRVQNDPPLCEESDDPDLVWNVTLKACIHKLPEDASDRGSHWPELWPSRLEKPPFWLKDSEVGVYGKPAPKDFTEDYEYWKHFVSESYLNHVEIDWSSVRNVMDMRAVYGGFAAALKDLQVWVMNVVPVDSTNTLPLIYERGLFGIYHDWCESFNTYPRTYGLLHADHLFSGLRRRCSNFVGVIAEVDRILRPGGKLIVIDDVETVSVIKGIAKSLKWMFLFNNARNEDRILCVKKSLLRPTMSETVDSTFA